VVSSFLYTTYDLREIIVPCISDSRH
jgi:hypothetical protein